MLVLSRRVTEGIWIEGGIFITVLEVKGGKVRLGVKAPRDLDVMRSELVVMDGPADESDLSESEPSGHEVTVKLDRETALSGRFVFPEGRLRWIAWSTIIGGQKSVSHSDQMQTIEVNSHAYKRLKQSGLVTQS